MSTTSSRWDHCGSPARRSRPRALEPVAVAGVDPDRRVQRPRSAVARDAPSADKFDDVGHVALVGEAKEADLIGLRLAGQEVEHGAGRGQSESVLQVSTEAFWDVLGHQEPTGPFVVPDLRAPGGLQLPWQLVKKPL